MAKEHKFVLPSGVGITVRSLKGKDQGTLTKQNVPNINDSINAMLADCIIKLGDVTNVTVKDVERMLSNDRKYALVELRQFSLRYKEVFEFSYEWAITGGRKETQEFNVTFNRDSFDTIPYSWVADKLKELEETNIEEYQKLIDSKEYYPLMYDSYSEMLLEQSKREFTTDDGDVVVWEVSDGLKEEKFSKVSKDLHDANLAIRMRVPKVKHLPKDGGNPVLVDWSFQNADIYDTENFRREMRRVEGFIDTALTIRHFEDKNREARVDLISTIDFFFPSQAI